MPLRLLIVILVLMSGAGCAALKPETDGATVSVANYTETGIVYARVEDLKQHNNMSGDSGILPYGGGGYVCCYSIPRKWHAGLQALVTVTYGKKDPDDENEENRIVSKVVPIGPYQRKDTGQIWILVHPNDDFELVVFNGDPNTEGWTGRVKGGPVMSKAYAQKIWERDVAFAQNDVNVCTKSIAEFNDSKYPEYWESRKRYTRKEVQQFEGPDDVNFRIYLQKSLKDTCDQLKGYLDILLKEKPL